MTQICSVVWQAMTQTGLISWALYMLKSTAVSLCKSIEKQWLFRSLVQRTSCNVFHTVKSLSEWKKHFTTSRDDKMPPAVHAGDTDGRTPQQGPCTCVLRICWKTAALPERMDNLRLSDRIWNVTGFLCLLFGFLWNKTIVWFSWLFLQVWVKNLSCDTILNTFFLPTDSSLSIFLYDAYNWPWPVIV